jgi:DNA-binding response OmpR family regulator
VGALHFTETAEPGCGPCPAKEDAMKERRFRVLICDFDADTLIRLEQLLENAGFDTTTTWDSTDLGRFSDAGFDLLVISDHPPQMNAEVILNDLRVRGVFHVLVLEASAGTSNLERLRSLGAIAVVPRWNHTAILGHVQTSLRRLESEPEQQSRAIAG